MRLTFQLLNGKKYSVDGVELDITVAALKQRLVDDHKVAPTVADIKLIHMGKIWSDVLVLNEIKFKETDTIVCMPSKIKAAAKVATAPVAAAADAVVASPVAIPVPAAPLQLQADAVLNPPAAVVAAAAAESTINELMGMGFARDLVLAALARTRNNPNTAAELLFQLGAGVLGMPVAPAAAAADVAMDQDDEDDHPDPDNNGDDGGDDDMDMPAGNPLMGEGEGGGQAMLRIIQAMAQQNPAALGAMLRGMNNPQMAGIMRDPAAMQGLINQAMAGGGGAGGGLPAAMPAGVQAIVQMLGAQRQAQVQAQAQLSAEDRQQIGELVAMVGKSEAECREAFLVCDKNMEAAVNFLFG